MTVMFDHVSCYRLYVFRPRVSLAYHVNVRTFCFFWTISFLALGTNKTAAGQTELPDTLVVK